MNCARDYLSVRLEKEVEVSLRAENKAHFGNHQQMKRVDFNQFF